MRLATLPGGMPSHQRAPAPCDLCGLAESVTCWLIQKVGRNVQRTKKVEYVLATLVEGQRGPPPRTLFQDHRHPVADLVHVGAVMERDRSIALS
jgi:hypothetical protein